MSNHLKLWGKRLLVMAVGLSLSMLIYKELYVFLRHHYSFWIAVGSTYAISAYLILPLAIRGIQMVIKPDHIPHHTMTPDGFANDPVNVGVVGTRTELKAIMKAAGWYTTDKRTLRSVTRMVLAILLEHPYPEAPFSNLYLLGRKQDLGFQLPLGNSPEHRHHVRFWECRAPKRSRHSEHVSFWRSKYRHHSERTLWLGAVTTDNGYGIIRYHAQTTHSIDPDTNKARDILAAELEKTGLVAKQRTIKAREPYTLKNRVLGVTMIADGELSISELVQG
jgi:LssY C-terminus